MRITALFNMRPLMFITGLLFFQLSGAQELEPRSYVNAPLGLKFVGLVYAYSDGDIYTSPAVPIENLTLRTDSQTVAYAQTFGLFGKSSKFDISAGHACASGKAIFKGAGVSRKFCGITDTKVRLSYNFYGAPALPLKDYSRYKRDIVVGASLQVNIPTGEYDTDYVFNIGSNRWYFRPEIGMSIPLKKWELDFSFGGKYFSDNEELKKTTTLSQDPIYNFQMHLIYDISLRQWAALNTNYFQGGDTYVDGLKTSFTKANIRSGFTYHYLIDPHNIVTFLASQGVTTRLGNETLVIAVAWLHRW